MPASTSTKLNTGAEMPTLGLGTWKSKPGQVEHAVEHALKHGYRHIDTATGYANEREVGLGIKASGVPREDIFLTTKLNNPDHTKVAAALDYSLEQLDTSYLDLWLMHWPAPMKDGKADRSVNWLDTWKEMERLYKAHPDKIKAIGVSNISAAWLDKLLAVATVTPAVNQIEGTPQLMQEDVVEACRKHGIVITVYSPLGSDGIPMASLLVVQKIAKKHGVEPTTILISLHANRPGVNVLAKSVTPNRIESNSKLIDLTDEEVRELAAIESEGRNRTAKPYWTGWGSLGFPDCSD